VKYLSAGSTFKVKVSGVRNPTENTTDGLSEGWSIKVVNYVESTDTTHIIMQQLNFFSFTFGSAFTAGNIVFNSISAFPLNAEELATYTITFTP